MFASSFLIFLIISQGSFSFVHRRDNFYDFLQAFNIDVMFSSIPNIFYR